MLYKAPTVERMNDPLCVCVCVRAEGQAAIKYILPQLSMMLLPWLNLFIYIANFILEFDVFIYVLGQRLLLSCFYFCDFLFVLSRLSPRRSHSRCTTDSLSVLVPSPPPPPPTLRHMTRLHKVMRLTISVLAASGWDLSCVQNLGHCQVHVFEYTASTSTF